VSLDPWHMKSILQYHTNLIRSRSCQQVVVKFPKVNVFGSSATETLFEHEAAVQCVPRCDAMRAMGSCEARRE
jgi:hypothetical protein